MVTTIKKLQQEIRSFIFEMVTTNPDYQISDLLIELSLKINTSLDANLTAIYTYNKWQEAFTLQGADEKEKALLPLQLYIDKNMPASVERSRLTLSKALNDPLSS